MRLIYAKLLNISLETKVTLGIGSMLKSLQVHRDYLEAAMNEVTQDAQLISNGVGVQNLMQARSNQKTNPGQNAPSMAK